MTRIPIDDQEIVAARSLRTDFVRFWSTAQGTPRDIYDNFIAATPTAAGVRSHETTDTPGPGWWYLPADVEKGRAVLFIHGGGYGLGHAKAYRGLCSQIAVRARAPVFALEYPLAPEATVGVALDLAVETVQRLSAEFKSVAVMGDSAGGGLALAAVLAATRKDIPVASLVLFSPWTDLSLSGDSARAQAVNDPLLDVAYLRGSAQAYLGGRPANDPQASPLFDPNLKLPPTLVQVGCDEVLLDDSRRLAEAAYKAGSVVELEEYEGMHHVFVLNTARLATARTALDRATAFQAQHWK